MNLTPPPDLAAFVAWATFIGGIIAVLASIFSKTVGGWTDASRRTRASRRANRKDVEDARIADLTQDLTYLRDRVEQLAAEQEHAWTLARAHMAWDWQRIRDLYRCDPDAVIPDPPPLIPSKGPTGTIPAPGRTVEEVRQVINTIEKKAQNGHGAPPPLEGE